ncbi:hypothetical protein CLAFUW4_08825 [Fulvia fulva]|nr:hypothetical protein CLAFUR4_08831 [Fulvia fulva]KAK4615224.1 hypothetical protein CLAFUR0_08823 [Fulvia fulva]WPV20360.1 hypothetical protein CLAFUW4_08825 [Fulvia fulva]WPV34885.1 hypothetical protein CLAFUW7_08826 [Fulvia fulva]
MPPGSTTTGAAAGASLLSQPLEISTKARNGDFAYQLLRSGEVVHDRDTLTISLRHEDGGEPFLCISSYKKTSHNAAKSERKAKVVQAMGTDGRLSQSRLAKMLLPLFRLHNWPDYDKAVAITYGPIAIAVFNTLDFDDTTHLNVLQVIKLDGLQEHQITGFNLCSESPLPGQGPCNFGTVILDTLKHDTPELFPELGDDEEHFEACLESEDIDEILDGEGRIEFGYEWYEKKQTVANPMLDRRLKVLQQKADAKVSPPQAEATRATPTSALVDDKSAKEHEKVIVANEQDALPSPDAQPPAAAEPKPEVQQEQKSSENKSGKAPLCDPPAPTNKKRVASEAGVEDQPANMRFKDDEQIGAPGVRAGGSALRCAFRA